MILFFDLMYCFHFFLWSIVLNADFCSLDNDILNAWNVDYYMISKILALEVPGSGLIREIIIKTYFEIRDSAYEAKL